MSAAIIAIALGAIYKWPTIMTTEPPGFGASVTVAREGLGNTNKVNVAAPRATSPTPKSASAT